MMINEISENGDYYGYTDNMKQIILPRAQSTKDLKI